MAAEAVVIELSRLAWRLTLLQAEAPQTSTRAEVEALAAALEIKSRLLLFMNSLFKRGLQSTCFLRRVLRS